MVCSLYGGQASLIQFTIFKMMVLLSNHAFVHLTFTYIVFCRAVIDRESQYKQVSQSCTECMRATCSCKHGG